MQMDGVAVRVDLPEKTMTFGIGEFNIGTTPRTSVCRCQHSRNSVITILKRKTMACTLAFVSVAFSWSVVGGSLPTRRSLATGSAPTSDMATSLRMLRPLEVER